MHRADITKPAFPGRRRYWIMALAMVLFLPPLSFLFQFTGDSNFCGTWCPRMFFVWRKGASLDAYFMGYLRSYMGVALVFGILLTTFFFGRYWCSHLCPIGGTMELGSRLVPRFLKINFAKIPAPAFRYGYLSVYFGAAALGLGSLCCSYCNFATIPRMIGAPFSGADMAYFLRTAGLINLGLVLLLGFFAKGGRAYCNLLCPIGALDGLSNRAGARWGRRVSVHPAKCNGCGDCLDSCPTWAIDLTDRTARIDALSCMPCGDCKTACARGAIDYGKTLLPIPAPKGKPAYEKG
ncbi:4Fe-4S binding protein [Desulfosarcina sp.]|uniref:4Fe-4S binding protein n=1 Tax=Desulfosarcina sp. TaxID=2027861 RepID=UPI0029A221CC|nr:4Fe-4S binding protein [Desulfosarcina sp.]MDX2453165.1 4Fe-4S binding protein [Desulfosarcina sp.]MDX2490894.1 4Fe-4S binding protein [Desulfosarcina sp.]